VILSAKFDIVVYGATGYTGQLVAEYLTAHYVGDGAHVQARQELRFPRDHDQPTSGGGG